MNLDYIKKINGTYNKSCKQSIIDEMLNQYEEASKNVITEFDVLINSSKAKNVFINNTPGKVLIEYKNNKNTQENDFMVEVKSYLATVDTGDYIYYYDDDLKENSVYIIPGRTEKKRGYEVSYGLYCNQVLRRSDWKKDGEYVSVPCNNSNDSYGSKTNLNNDFIAETDTKLKITAQFNDYTRTIKKDDRFIFNSNENDIFKVIDISTSINKGAIVLTCKKDVFKPEYDDLENNLAWNGETITSEPTDYEILGEDSVRVNNSYTYTLSPTSTNTSWSLDDFTINNNIAEINIIDDNTVIVKGLKSGEYFELTCEVDGKQIIKEIMVVR